ncbi:conserved hypothetical protein [uncultured Desulfatiglans sp.]|nr:conserved hypothetical protein [uncultured Desulfatiglans sp.]
MKRTKNHVLILYVSSIFLMVLVWGIQWKLIRLGLAETGVTLSDCPWCEEGGDFEDVVFLPRNASTLRLLAPADVDFLADLLWLRCVYYFGRHALTNREYPYLHHILDLITDLAPAWRWPFFFGAVVFATEIQAYDPGISLIEKGLQFHRADWQLWFYKGYYLWKYAEDALGAADALGEAADLPGAPSFLKGLAASLANRAGHRELAVSLIENALKQTIDPAQQERLVQKREEILSNEGTRR